jgi:hypothetical protein
LIISSVLNPLGHAAIRALAQYHCGPSEFPGLKIRLPGINVTGGEKVKPHARFQPAHIWNRLSITRLEMPKSK